MVPLKSSAVLPFPCMPMYRFTPTFYGMEPVVLGRLGGPVHEYLQLARRLHAREVVPLPVQDVDAGGLQVDPVSPVVVEE